MQRGILLSAVGAFWAAAYLIPFKAAAAVAPAEALVLPMLLVAAVLNTIPAGIAGVRRKPRLDRTAIVVAALLGILSALGNEAMAHALARIGPGPASVMLRIQVIFVALGAWWVLGERVTPRFWIGALLALAGFALLQRHLGGEADAPAAGMLWALLAAVAFGAMQVIVRKTILRIDPLLVNSLRLWIAVLLMACIPGRLGLLARADLNLWLLCATAALLGPVTSRICMMLALRHVPVALSTLVLFVAPVFAFALGGLFFGSWPGPAEIGGSLVILLGVALPVIEMARASAPK